MQPPTFPLPARWLTGEVWGARASLAAVFPDHRRAGSRAGVELTELTELTELLETQAEHGCCLFAKYLPLSASALGEGERRRGLPVGG